MERGNRQLQFLIVTALSTAAITNGISQTWSAPVITKFHNNETDFHITKTEISWIGSISSWGYICGSVVSRFTSDRLGRRVTVLGSALPVIIGAILKNLASSAVTICIARLFWGMGSGMLNNVVVVYITEIADKDIRGGISIANRFMISFGCLLMMIVGPLVSYRTINYILLALPICFFTTCWWIPETPYFLIKEGRVDAARKTLARLTNIKDEDLLEDRLSEMRSQVRQEMSRSGTAKEFFTSKRYRKSIIIVVGVKLAQLMAGMRALQTYLGLIIQESNTGLSVSAALIIFGVVRFTLGIVSSLLIDRVGRRPLIIYSFFGAFITHSTVGTYFFLKNYYNYEMPSPLDLIPFVGIIATELIAVLGYESVMYCLPAELFPLNIKQVAMTSLNIMGGILVFTSVKSYQPIKDLTGLYGVFWLFGTATLFGSVYAYFLIPETKGKSLKEIQIELYGNIYDEEQEKLRTENNGDVGKIIELKALNLEGNHKT